jgi:glycosyltransferase involved in cell wall biosynthesis
MSSPLSVVSVHGFYRWPGGEDAVFRSELRMLEENGHRVQAWTRDNKALEHLSRGAALRTCLWNQESYADFREVLRREQPDVVHCHNTFGVISPAVYYAARAEGIPLVQTLHNYRYQCLNGLLFRNGHVCEDCLARAVPVPGVVHRCYRDSLSASLGMCMVHSVHRALRTWRRHVDAFIVPTPSARPRFVAAGLPFEKLFVKPHVVFDSGVRSVPPGDYVLFAGRLSEEKGIQTLVEAWQRLSDIPLKVAGDGPMREVVNAAQTVDAVGWVGRDDFGSLLRHARFVVVPSVCYEQFGMVIAEACCCGVPVVAADHGAMADLVQDGETGMLFAAGDAGALGQAVRSMWSDVASCRRMGVQARKQYEMRFAPKENYRALDHIYRSALNPQSRL